MKILHLISSPRGRESISIKLGNEIIDRLKEKYPGSTVHVHNLTEQPLPHLDDIHLQSFATPVGTRTPELEQAARYSEEAVHELMDADILVIGVPMYNFGVHSALKTWIDHIMRAGITFRYTEEGPVGLVNNKKAFLAISSGGIYSSGERKSFDFAEPYVKSMLNFIGISDVTTYRVEGLAIPGIQEKAYDTTLELLEV